MHVRYRMWSGALEPHSVEKEQTVNAFAYRRKIETLFSYTRAKLGISSVD